MLKEVGDDGITLAIAQKVKKEGQKKPVTEYVDTVLPYSNIKKAVYDLKF